MASYLWNTAQNGAFDDLADWRNAADNSPATALPGADDLVAFSVAATVSGSGDVAEVDVEAALTLDAIALTTATLRIGPLGSGTTLTLGQGSTLTFGAFAANAPFAIALDGGILDSNGAVSGVSAGSRSSTFDLASGVWNADAPVGGLQLTQEGGALDASAALTGIDGFEASSGDDILENLTTYGDDTLGKFFFPVNYPFSNPPAPNVNADDVTLLPDAADPAPVLTVQYGASLTAAELNGSGVADIDDAFEGFIAVSGAVDDFASVNVSASRFQANSLSAGAVAVEGGADLSLTGALTAQTLSLSAGGDLEFDAATVSGAVDLAGAVNGGYAHFAKGMTLEKFANVTLSYYSGGNITLAGPATLSIAVAPSIGPYIYGSDSQLTLGGGIYGVVGGGDTIRPINGAALRLADTDGEWDTVYFASGASVLLDEVQASLVGGGGQFIAGPGSTVSLYGTAGDWDTLNLDDAQAILEGAQASVFGGDDAIYLEADDGVGSVVSLYQTDDAWDTVYATRQEVILTQAQASVFGGGDLIFASGSGSALSLYETGNDWDSVYASSAEVILTGAQASLFGGGDLIFASGAGAAISLYNTANDWDTVYASGAEIILTGAQASVLGGGDQIYASGAGAAVSLYQTNGDWDTVTASGAEVLLTSAQASVFGGGDAIYANGGSALSLYNGTDDTVTGSGFSLALHSASATLKGSSDSLWFAGASALTLTGGGDALYFDATSGLATVSGFANSDVIHLNEFGSYAALLQSGHLIALGGDTVIKLDNADQLTLHGVAEPMLTSANFAFS